MRKVLVVFFLGILLFFSPAACFSREVPVGCGEVVSPAKSPAGTFNAKRALVMLNGKVIPPGGTFSFNVAVGPRTVSRGFVVSRSVVGKSMAPDVGGGVCQAATALYRAAIRAGMRIVERHRHSLPVSYARGDNAAVWFGKWDLQFVNVLPFPVAIKTSADGRLLRAGLWAMGFPGGDYRAAFLIGKTVAFADGRLCKLASAPLVREGIAYAAARDLAAVFGVPEERVGSGIWIPIGDAAAALGMAVSWDPAARAVLVKPEAKPEAGSQAETPEPASQHKPAKDSTTALAFSGTP